MNAYLNDSKQMLGRADQFCVDHAGILNTAAQAIVPKIATSIAEINSLGGGQFAGFAQFQSGAALRREAAKELRQMLTDIAHTARVLDEAGVHPGLSETLRLGGRATRSYQQVHDASAAFIEGLSPAAVLASYTARGYSATLIEDIEELMAALETAAGIKHSGINKRVNSTASLTTAARKGVVAVRDLDAILTPQLRKTDPGLYAEWKRATHIRSRPVSASSEPSAPPQSLAAVVGEEGVAVPGSTEEPATASAIV